MLISEVLFKPNNQEPPTLAQAQPIAGVSTKVPCTAPGMPQELLAAATFPSEIGLDLSTSCMTLLPSNANRW